MNPVKYRKTKSNRSDQAFRVADTGGRFRLDLEASPTRDPVQASQVLSN